MQPEELKTLLAKPEGPELEFAGENVSEERIARVIAAFANTRGGRLVIGVDESRGVHGLEDPVKTEARVNRALALITPPPLAAASRVDVDGVPYVVAGVSREPGHLYLADRELLERDGALVRPMSPQRLKQLTATHGEAAPTPARENTQVLIEAISGLQDGIAKLQTQNSFGRRAAIAVAGAAFGALLKPIIDFLS